MSQISCDHKTHSHTGEPVLDIDVEIELGNFSLTFNQKIPQHGIVGIYGHSGSGKSTLLRIIAGLEQGAKGVISLNNSPLQNTLERKFIAPEHRNIGLVFQDSRLFPHLSVFQNLQFAAKRCKESQLTIEQVIQLTQLTSLTRHSVGQLSGGEKQRVSLARALLAEPKLLLLDEPFSALDKSTKSQMLSILKNVQQQLGLPMLYVSHSLNELQYIADRLITVSQGCFAQASPIHQAIHELNSQDIETPKTSLSLSIQEHLVEYGLTRLSINALDTPNESIYLPLIPQDETSLTHQLRCIIYARDISISTTKPEHSSIVNQLAGCITHIKLNKTNALITIVSAEQVFYAQISIWSVKRMALTAKTVVYIQFKANAVHSFQSTESLSHA